jgi:hypothetical protein
MEHIAKYRPQIRHIRTLRITQWNLYIRCCLPFCRGRVVDLSLTRQVISRRASGLVQFASSASPPLWVLTSPALRLQFTLSVLFAFQVPYKEYCLSQNYTVPISLNIFLATRLSPRIFNRHEC